MKTRIFFILIICFFLVAGFQKVKDNETGIWRNSLIKMGYLNTPLVEVEPFVFKGELYLLENWRSHWNWPGQPYENLGKNCEMWIAHLPNGPEDYQGRKYLSAALTDNTLGYAIEWKDRVYVFGVNETGNRKFVEMSWSDDLKNWSKPVKVFDSPSGKIFNISLTPDDKGFVFQWETNGIGTPFTMCFGRIKNLDDNWNDNIIENACYGMDKYTGAPSVIYESGWYYFLYAERVSNGWETRITRSKDLINWEDAPADRPFVTFDTSHKNLPLHPADVHEINATDVGLTYYNGEVIVYFTGGIQQKGGDLQWARYKGTVRELMEYFFID